MDAREQATKQATLAFWKYSNRWMQLQAFRRYAVLGIRTAGPIMHRENLKFAVDMRDTDAYDHFWKDKKAVLEKMDPPDEVAEKLTAQQQGQFRSAIDSAILIFAHSILDAAALDYIAISLVLAPEDVEQFIAERRVPLAEAARRPYAEIRQEYLNVWLEQVERESLLKKWTLPTSYANRQRTSMRSGTTSTTGSDLRGWTAYATMLCTVMFRTI